MNRRTMLRVGGMAAVGLGAAACGVRAPARPAAPAQPAVRLAPVDVSPERVIRTVVGLRPFRSGGFRVEIEKLDGKTLVHHYGHGGAGVSLSWGTAFLAADLALEAGGAGAAAVVGCGAVGLATARTLQRRGYEVTIYADKVPPETTSNAAPAGFTPASRVIDMNRRTEAFDARYARAAEIAFHAWQLLAGEHYGVRWLYDYSPVEAIPPAGAGGMSQLLQRIGGERVVLGPGQHPFAEPHAIRRTNMMIETPIYLAAVLRDFFQWGGRLVARKMNGPGDLVSLPEPIVFTCVGLGARDLLGDDQMEPVKGQLAILMPQPEIDYTLTPGGGLYMMPRRDGIVLGGTGERGVWSLDLNEEAHARILEGHLEMAGAIRRSQARRSFRAAAARAAALPPPEPPRHNTRESFLALLDARDPGF